MYVTLWASCLPFWVRRPTVWCNARPRPTACRATHHRHVFLFSQAGYDLDQALVMCQMNNFKAGILYLYEKAKL